MKNIPAGTAVSFNQHIHVHINLYLLKSTCNLCAYNLKYLSSCGYYDSNTFSKQRIISNEKQKEEELVKRSKVELIFLREILDNSRIYFGIPSFMRFCGRYIISCNSLFIHLVILRNKLHIPLILCHKLITNPVD
jgi:hypothetical protein